MPESAVTATDKMAPMRASNAWHTGYAAHDRDDNGWLIGHFATGARGANFSRDVEIKWSDHAAGDAQDEWQETPGTSVSILVAGYMTISFKDGEAILAEQGDYVLGGPLVSHRWRAEKTTTIITIRWPSLPPEGQEA
jgi:hypothetical protein